MTSFRPEMCVEAINIPKLHALRVHKAVDTARFSGDQQKYKAVDTARFSGDFQCTMLLKKDPPAISRDVFSPWAIATQHIRFP
jgi:hypothetical protein